LFLFADSVDEVEGPPPPYSIEDPAVSKQSQESSTFQRICQFTVIVSAFGLAIIWSYYYISHQRSCPPFSGVLVAELVLLTLYLAMLGFFTFVFAMQAVFPVMVRLGDYATHKAGRIRKVLAILGIVGIWGGCLVWVVGVPLIPGIGGVIMRNAA
jgi:hypothetical protein